jgi:hypothetical protein
LLCFELFSAVDMLLRRDCTVAICALLAIFQEKAVTPRESLER